MKYTISNEKIKITMDTLGGEMTSIVSKDLEYVWQGDNLYWGGQAPVCFPITGNIREGKATAFGKECNMPRHGIARTQEFELACNDDSSIIFFLRANEETLAKYPFDFELQIKYSIENDTVTVCYTVINHDSEKMPFTIGGHPAFNCPFVGGEEFKDYFLEFEQEENAHCYRPDMATGLIDIAQHHEGLKETNKLQLFHFLFNDDAMIFTDLKSQKVALKSDKCCRGIEMDYSDFNNLLIWSSRGDTPFIAIEPWTGLATCSDEDDRLESKRGTTILHSGEQKSFKYSIRIF